MEIPRRRRMIPTCQKEPEPPPMRGRGCPAAGRPPSPLRGARPRRRPRREAPPAAPAVAHRLPSRRRSIPRSTRIRIGPIRSMRSTGIIRRCLCRRRLIRIRRRRRTRRLEGEGPQREEQLRQHRQRPSRVRQRPPMPPLRPLLPQALLPPAPPPVRCIIISRIHRSLRRRRRLGLDRGPEPSSYRPRHPGEASRGRWPT